MHYVHYLEKKKKYNWHKIERERETERERERKRERERETRERERDWKCKPIMQAIIISAFKMGRENDGQNTQLRQDIHLALPEARVAGSEQE